MITKLTHLALGLWLGASFASFVHADDNQPPVKLSEQEANAIAKDAYVYAYPLILTHITLQKLSNFAEPIEDDAFGPPNQFHHARAKNAILIVEFAKDWKPRPVRRRSVTVDQVFSRCSGSC